MNKDEMKMIEDNKRKETEFETMTHFDDPSIPHICVIPCYRSGAETLYDANCRIIADDEIVIKADIKCVDSTTAVNVIDFFAKHNAKVRQETAREILQELYDEAMRNTNEVVELTAFEIKQLAKEKGIELED